MKKVLTIGIVLAALGFAVPAAAGINPFSEGGEPRPCDCSSSCTCGEDCTCAAGEPCSGDCTCAGDSCACDSCTCGGDCTCTEGEACSGSCTCGSDSTPRSCGSGCSPAGAGCSAPVEGQPVSGHCGMGGCGR